MPLSVRRHKHILSDVRLVIVRPSYPENIGAVARAMRVTGFHELILVSPHALADPLHPNAIKMAVGAEAILRKTAIVENFGQAVQGFDIVAGTSSRAGVKNVWTPKKAADFLLTAVSSGKRISLVFGGERNGLKREEITLCDPMIRIPMAGSEPSYNLAQAAMVILYELLVVTM